ncbi:MAG: hypothetical protein SWX82_14400 [Cyanobacteriota bacterium]|nr:hypothetical protein [Cyanobacteriota bacterium]
MRLDIRGGLTPTFKRFYTDATGFDIIPRRLNCVYKLISNPVGLHIESDYIISVYTSIMTSIFNLPYSPTPLLPTPYSLLPTPPLPYSPTPLLPTI